MLNVRAILWLFLIHQLVCPAEELDGRSCLKWRVHETICSVVFTEGGNSNLCDVRSTYLFVVTLEGK